MKLCLQRGEVDYNEQDGNFTHFRVDGCLIKDNDVKKCDCLIVFSSRSLTKPVFFTVEFKSSASYDLSNIQSQIQTCLDKISLDLGRYNDKVVPVPVFIAPNHRKHIQRWLLAYRVEYRSMKLLMSHLKTGDNILNALERKD